MPLKDIVTIEFKKLPSGSIRNKNYLILRLTEHDSSRNYSILCIYEYVELTESNVSNLNIFKIHPCIVLSFMPEQSTDLFYSNLFVKIFKAKKIIR